VSRFDFDELDASVQFFSRNGLPSEHSILFQDLPLLNEEFQVFFIVTGDVSLLIDKEMHRIEPGSLVVFSSQEVHKVHVRSNKPYIRRRLVFKPEIARAFEHSGYDLLSCFMDRPKGKGNIRKLAQSQSVELLKLFDKFGQAFVSDVPEAKVLELAAFLEILVFTNRVFGESDGKTEKSSLPDSLASIMDYIEDHIAGDLSLETISASCDIGKNYLCRLFKKETGVTLHNYILYKRVAEAKRLLGEGVKPSQARGMCGFGTMGRFSVAFKKIVGASPSAFAKRKKEVLELRESIIED
jgi:AraC-like DNA-binding protein